MTLNLDQTLRVGAFLVISLGGAVHAQASHECDWRVAAFQASGHEEYPVYEGKTFPLYDISKSQECTQVKRCLIELGSSNAKAFCAEGNPCTGQFGPAHALGKEALNLSHYTNSDGALTQEGMKRISGVVKDMKSQIIAKDLGRIQLSMTATAAIRDAVNSQMIQDWVFQQSGGIPVTVLSQKQEALFAAITACEFMRARGQDISEKAIFVDQGGGSTQVIKVPVRGEPMGEMFLKKMGTHNVVEAIKGLFMSELGLSHNQIFPFPQATAYGSGLLDYVYSHIAKLFGMTGVSMKNVQASATVGYGVARAHQFCVLPLANPSGDNFTTKQVGEALERFSRLKESEIMRLYPSVQNPLEDFATMLLTYTLMTHFGMNGMNVLPVPGSSLSSAIRLLPTWKSLSPNMKPHIPDQTSGQTAQR